jgi:RNA polymerase sigma factor (sigma-70 family)
VGRAQTGDRAAFAEIYDAYADRIHDFCRSLLRDPHDAADAMQDTFVLAVQRLDQLRDPERLHSWLFAIARHVSFRKLQQRKRATPVAVSIDLVSLTDDSDIERELSASTAAELVWAAAVGLNDRDRAVIDLNARHGIEGPELAAAIGLEHANPYSLLHRAKTQLERAVRVLLVARTGRRDCDALAEMLEDWDGTLTPLLRKRIGRHIDQCATCGRTTARANPLALLAATPLVKISKADALDADHLIDIAAHRPEPEERWLPDGFPPPLEPLAQRRRLFLMLVGAGVIVVVTGVTFTAGANNTHGHTTATTGVGRPTRAGFAPRHNTPTRTPASSITPVRPVTTPTPASSPASAAPGTLTPTAPSSTPHPTPTTGHLTPTTTPKTTTTGTVAVSTTTLSPT